MSFFRKTQAIGLGLSLLALSACSIGDNIAPEPPPTEPSFAVHTPETRPEPATIPSVSSNYPFLGAVDNGIYTQGNVMSYYGLSLDEADALERCGNQTDRVLLTFDDGAGSNENSQEIAAYLQSENIGAIFFPLPEGVDSIERQTLRDKGFWVGNHSLDHPDLVQLSVSEIEDQIINGATGLESNLFRPPYGATSASTQGPLFDNRVLTAANNLGMRICNWTVDSLDYDVSLTANDIAERVVGQIQPGSVVLFHTKPHTNVYDSLPIIVESIRAQGLEFCELPDAPTEFEIPESLPCDS